MREVPKVGDWIEMQSPTCIGWGNGWINAVVTRAVTVVTADAGDVAIVAASGLDADGNVVGPHVTGFWDSGHFR
jgi:hypothetical protein